MMNFIIVFCLLVTTGLLAEIKPLLLKNSLEVNGKTYKQMSDLPPLKLGDKVTTLTRSYFIFSIEQELGKATFKVSPKSSIIITESKMINLDSGSLFSKFESKVKSDQIKLEIKTKVAAMGVRGTYFFASYGKSNDLWMCVKEGEVEVVDINQKRLAPVKFHLCQVRDEFA